MSKTIHIRSGRGTVIIVSDGEEYECRSAEELWSDVHEILGDPVRPKYRRNPDHIPGTQVIREATTDDIDLSDPDSLYEAACATAEEVAGQEYGPLARAVVGKATRAGQGTVMSILRNMSRKPKRRGR